MIAGCVICLIVGVLLAWLWAYPRHLQARDAIRNTTNRCYLCGRFLSGDIRRVHVYPVTGNYVSVECDRCHARFSRRHHVSR